FPEGGGQASDNGKLDIANVLDVQEKSGQIIHYTDLPLKEGGTVTGILDWERRFDFMQQHSGEHIVSGIAHSLYGCENVGFHLGNDIVTVDFDISLSRQQILRIEDQANEAVYKNVKFTTYYPDKKTLSTLNYRSKKEIDENLRIVEIEGTDICACCAPHVKSAAEIGIIKLLDSEKLRGGVRIEMKCGRRALADYNIKYDNVRSISCDLAVKQEQAAEGVKRLLDDISDLKQKLALLKRQSIEQKVAAFLDDRKITAVFENDLEIKELQVFADKLHKAYGGIRGVLSPTKDGFLFAVCGKDDILDRFFKEFKGNLNVRGGGRNGMVQGTVFAKMEDVIKFFENSPENLYFD
ncbi:MAG: alanyl-tRNA editing protein, partial [Acutalibacteraceae bacterium]